MAKDAFFAGPEFFNLNWDQSVDHTVAAATSAVQFESAMSSLVSSPSSNPAPRPAIVENVMIHELIGRLGSICNSGEISPPSHFTATTNTPNTSCYNTPLNSPPKRSFVPPASIASFSGDPGFAERAARYSCFGGRNIASFPGQFSGGLPEASAAANGGKLSRVSSSQSLKAMPGGAPAPMEEVSSASGESNSRKRKAAGAAGTAKGKGRETTLSSSKNSEEEEASAKRSKSGESDGGEKEEKNGNGNSNGNGSQKQGKETTTKPLEPPKDYIHVRARRGQATDSHSLAERVRREKISQRMKFLQDLVPGCNKVTGKAVMLDEIINYVQSLQRQVEFLSMKLATVNPRLEFNMGNFLPKDLDQSRGGMSGYPLEAAAAAAGFPFGYHARQGASVQSGVTSTVLEGQCSVNPLALSMQLPSHNGFVDVAAAAASQIGNFWEDDLQSVVQMGFGQSQEATFSAQSLHESMTTANMKIEL